MTKTEKRMEELITMNSSQYIDGIWVTDIVEGTITANKEEKFTLDFRETGFRKRGDIFSKSSIAPYFSELFLQMLSARFDMILRVCGSVLVRQLNGSNPNWGKVVINVRLGIGVENDFPISCPYIGVKSWGYDGEETLEEELFYEAVEIMVENLHLLTDSFLEELKDIAETVPRISDTIPSISVVH